MDPKYSAIRDLDKSKDDWVVKVKVVRKWEIYGVRMKLDPRFDFIFVDEHGGQMHGSVDKHLYSKFNHLIEEGMVLMISNFKVEERVHQYCPWPYKFKISLKHTTIVEPLPEEISFPSQRFAFCQYEALGQRLLNDSVLTDVMGLVNTLAEVETISVKGASKEKRDLIIDNEKGKALRVTFWEEHISKLPATLAAEGRDVIVVTSASVRSFQGEYFLQPTFATKLYINPDIPEASSLAASACSPKGKLPSYLRAVKKRQSPSSASKPLQSTLQTINDIIMLIRDCKEGFYTCQASVIKVYVDKEWTYESCPECSRGLKCTDGVYRCWVCPEPVKNPVTKIKLQLQVKDATGSLDVTVFEEKANIFFNCAASELIKLKAKNSDQLLSELFAEPIDKQFTLCLKVSKYNTDYPGSALAVTEAIPISQDSKKKKKLFM